MAKFDYDAGVAQLVRALDCGSRGRRFESRRQYCFKGASDVVVKCAKFLPCGNRKRIAKMEAGDPSVSLDLLVRSLLVFGGIEELQSQWQITSVITHKCVLIFALVTLPTAIWYII